MVLFGVTQLALLCSWFIEGGLFLDLPFDSVLDFHDSQPPNVPRQGCAILIFMFEIVPVASIALLKCATGHFLIGPQTGCWGFVLLNNKTRYYKMVKNKNMQFWMENLKMKEKGQNIFWPSRAGIPTPDFLIMLAWKFKFPPTIWIFKVIGTNLLSLLKSN